MKVPEFMLWACALLPGIAGGADIYRCDEPSGQPRFQQTPCASGGAPLQLAPPAGRWEPLRPGERDMLRQRTARPPAKPRAAKPRDSQAAERRCWHKRKRLEAVSAKLRRGYKPAQGERLRRQRDNLDEYLRLYCD